MTTTSGKTTTAIRFPDDLREQIQAAAEERDWSMNTLVVRATRDYVERLVPADELEYVKT
ncbi:MAG: hypothetical protein GY798_28965 [Hyphomicrobiales bacterium]|nr:hypothetical protein [Hyphomicrobiales bacterium]